MFETSDINLLHDVTKEVYFSLFDYLVIGAQNFDTFWGLAILDQKDVPFLVDAVGEFETLIELKKEIVRQLNNLTREKKEALLVAVLNARLVEQCLYLNN